MSATTQTPESGTVASGNRKVPRTQIVTTVIAVIGSVLFIYLAPANKTTVFRLSLGHEALNISDWTVNSKTAAILFGVLSIGFALATWLTIKHKKLTLVLVGLSVFSLLLAFLSWVAAGKQTVVPVTGLLQGSVFLAVPLIYGAMSGVLSERAGVININIEGQLLMGAFLAAVVASTTSSLMLGLIAAPIGGVLLGLLLAVFATRYFVDQVVVGVVLNVLAIGLTTFLYSTFLAPNQNTLNSPPTFQAINIPVLSKIPVLGPIFFQQSIIVYMMYALVVIVQFYLFHTRWGLRVRSVGEYPDAADSVGIKVNRTRFRTVVIASAVAGLGGAYFTIGTVGPFGKELTSGKGFIALAAVILGRWTPLGAVAAALLFGFADQLQNILSIIGTPIPSQFLLMTPYIATILAVAGLVGRVRAPGADGIPFKK